VLVVEAYAVWWRAFRWTVRGGARAWLRVVELVLR
jgi:hypothetical protein